MRTVDTRYCDASRGWMSEQRRFGKWWWEKELRVISQSLMKSRGRGIKCLKLRRCFEISQAGPAQTFAKFQSYRWPLSIYLFNVIMMTSSNGNIFRISGLLCGEFIGHQWIPLTKTTDAELRCFFDLRLNRQLSKQYRRWWFETLQRLLWRHCNVS